jgi:membrane associated rhomboid family serine protease
MSHREDGLFGISDLPFRFVFLMWLTFTVQFYTHWNLYFLGVMPRTIFGLVGILTGPLIHSGFYHIFTNSIPILFLGTVLFFFYNKIGKPVFFSSYFIPNIFVWIFSPRSTYHIGASGIVYALAAFLIVIGILKRDIISLFVAAAIAMIYGSIFMYALVPQDDSVSWEGHLGGAITGIGVALYFHFRNSRTIV